MERRVFLRATLGAAWFPIVGCAHHAALKACPGPHSDFDVLKEQGLTVLRIGPTSGRPIVLLHELPGLSPDDLALARCMSKEGFNVHAPVLFGEPWQDNVGRGFHQACQSRRFECAALKTRSPILDALEPFCDRIAHQSNGPIGVVGMCLSGILPLALLPNGVDAAVLCQPTLPFDWLHGAPVGDQITDLGLGATDLDDALLSHVPFLALHYNADTRCPTKRMQELELRFKDRVAVVNLPGKGLHSTLGGDLNKRAFADAMAYLKVRLRVEAGPKSMQVAHLGTRPCQISETGYWRAL
jgi:dienelactone hydrolase